MHAALLSDPRVRRVLWRRTPMALQHWMSRRTAWSIGLYHGDTPLDIQPVADAGNPILTYRDVDDIDALFVADPFAVQLDGI